jgi:hypothetical protein
MRHIWEIFSVDARALNPRVNILEILEETKEIFLPLELLEHPRLDHLFNIGIGIEIEVENTKALHSKYWLADRDGSLRGEYAKEYISYFGLRLGESYKALKELCDGIRLARSVFKNNTLFQFSERTSTHIHLDCRLMTLDQVRSFIQLYILFEDALFNFASPERTENIFCVPIRKAEQLGCFNQIDTYVNCWGKYSAFNLKALKEKGTIEFRHMGGMNADARYVFTWIVLLGLLHFCATKWSRKYVIESLERLKGESQYELFAKRVFGSFNTFLELNPVEMDSAVSDAKLFNEV